MGESGIPFLQKIKTRSQCKRIVVFYYFDAPNTASYRKLCFFSQLLVLNVNNS